jgi:hypothetical protein
MVEVVLLLQIQQQELVVVQLVQELLEQPNLLLEPQPEELVELE